MDFFTPATTTQLFAGHKEVECFPCLPYFGRW